MKFTSDYAPLLSRINGAFESAVDKTLDDHRSGARRVTGEYAASLRATRDGLTARIGSDLPRAAAMRFGADVGARRGPHHGPVDTYDDGREFVERMGEELR